MAQITNVRNDMPIKLKFKFGPDNWNYQPHFRAEQVEVVVRSGCNAERGRQEPKGKQELGGDHGRDHHHRGGEAQDPGSAAAGRWCRGEGRAPPAGSGGGKAGPRTGTARARRERERQEPEQMGPRSGSGFARWSAVLRGPACPEMKLKSGGWVGLRFTWTSSGWGGHRLLERAGLTFEGIEPHGVWGVVFFLFSPSSFIQSLQVGRGQGRGSAASPSPTSPVGWGTLLSFGVSGPKGESRWMPLWSGGEPRRIYSERVGGGGWELPESPRPGLLAAFPLPPPAQEMRQQSTEEAVPSLEEVEATAPPPILRSGALSS